MATITFSTFTVNISSTTNYNSTQGYQFNVTVTNDTLISYVWIRANFSSTFANYTAITYNASIYYYNNNSLAAGTYTYTWNANDTALAFYNSSNQTYQVTQNTTVLSLTLNGTAGDRSYFNNTAVNLGNTTTPGYINSSLAFYYNTSASTAWNAIALPQNWTINSLNASVYWVLMNFTGNQNYTNATDIHMLTLNDSRIIFGNFSNNVTNSNSTNYSSTQGYQFNVTAFNSSQYNTVWIRANFSGAFVNYTASPYGVTQFYYNAGVLATGNYTYTWCANNSLLAYFNSSNQTFRVNQSYLPITLYINGTDDDSTTYNYSVANLTANFSSSYSFNITLWTNLTGSWTLLDNEPSPITNYTDLTPYQAVNYSVIANWTGNANYTISNASHYLTLALYTAPPAPPTGNTGGWSGSSGPSQTGSQSVTLATVQADTPSVATFSDKLIAIVAVNLTYSADVSNVKITVKNLDLAPTGVSAPSGTVYKYIEITTQNLDPPLISKVKIKFRVNSTWYTGNNLDPKTTKLMRLVGTSWEAYSATQTGSDSSYYYFEASTIGFSTFAVTATEKVTPPATTTCTTTCPSSQSQRAYPDCSCYTPTQPTGEKPGEQVTAAQPNYDWVVFVVVIIVVTAMLVLMVKKRIKSTAKHHHR